MRLRETVATAALGMSLAVGAVACADTSRGPGNARPANASSDPNDISKLGGVPVKPVDPTKVPSLVEQLKSSDEAKRVSAATDLGNVYPPSADAVPALVAALSDASPKVRATAANSLAVIGSPARSAAAQSA